MDKVRGLLPAKGQAMFDDIVFQRVLGASSHIRMIGDMFLMLAEKAREEEMEPKQLREELKAVGDFFRRTRGEASQAVSNGIGIMLLKMGLSEWDELGLEEVTKRTCTAVEYYAKQSEKDISAVIQYAVGIAGYMKRIMVFDYSSTVNSFLKELGREAEGIEVYIPESRSINGGYAFVPAALEAGMTIHFIPDAAIMYFLKTCDGAFFGAETLYADGTVYNTTGSDIVGLVCRTFNIPLYVLTPMIKLDLRPIRGFQRELVVNDLQERFAEIGFKKDEMEQVDFRCPELLPIEGKYIDGIITELGIIPAGALYQTAIEYGRKLMLGEGEQ
ncbi:hypothetical protein AALB16_02790 [Lachnospiraceae bacterium 62-35]